MNRTAVMAIVMVAVLCLSLDAYCETKGKSGTPAEVLLKKTEPRSVAKMMHKGPFTDMPTVITRLRAEMDKAGYLPAGPVMCMFFNSPDQVAQKDLQWEVMIPVPHPGAIGTSDLDKMGFSYLAVLYVACIYHIGPYEKIGDTYKTLFSWAETNGYKNTGLPIESYWSDPQTAPKDKLVTEIWLPVEERTTQKAFMK